MDKIFSEVGVYYAPYPELSDLVVSDLLQSPVIARSTLLSRYKKTFAHHRIVKTLTNLQDLGIIHRFDDVISLLLPAEQAGKLHAANLTQTEMRILAYIRKNGSVYYAPFFLHTRANRTLFNKCARYLIDADLLEMHKEVTERGGSFRHVYTFKPQAAPMLKPASITFV